MARLLKLAISIAYLACGLPFELAARLFGVGGRSRCVILYYHAVPSVQRARFGRQMDLLVRWSNAVPADLSAPMEPGRRYVAVTFDDGFLSVLRNALPELEIRGIPFTVFIVTGLLGKTPPWAGQYSVGYHLDRIVTLEELGEMRSHTVQIGSHTVTHPDMTTLGRQRALEELAGSRESLEKWLGRDVPLFSFPYGEYDRSAVDLCREAGYGRVFTTYRRLGIAPREDYVADRLPVEVTDWDLEFILKLCGAYCWLPYAIALKHRLLSAFAFPARKNPFLSVL